jgi:hypothetical protein
MIFYTSNSNSSILCILSIAFSSIVVRLLKIYIVIHDKKFDWQLFFNYLIYPLFLHFLWSSWVFSIFICRFFKFRSSWFYFFDGIWLTFFENTLTYFFLFLYKHIKSYPWITLYFFMFFLKMSYLVSFLLSSYVSIIFFFSFVN